MRDAELTTRRVYTSVSQTYPSPRSRRAQQRACFVVGCFFSAKSVERLASNGGVEGESADPVRALCMSARQPEQRAAKNEVSFWVLSVSVSTTD